MTPRFSFSLSGGKGSALISATATHSPDGRCLVDDRARKYMEATYRSAERRLYSGFIQSRRRSPSQRSDVEYISFFLFFFFAPLPLVNLHSVHFFGRVSLVLLWWHISALAVQQNVLLRIAGCILAEV